MGLSTLLFTSREGSGSVVECLTLDRGFAGSSLVSLSKAHYSLLSTGSIPGDPFTLLKNS